MNDMKVLKKAIKVLLWLYTIHSTLVALGLVFIPSKYLNIFGLINYQGSFFQTQAGVFHLVMAVAYALAAQKADPSCPLIWFIIIAKSMAFIFLLIYYLFFEQAWVIGVSALGDGLMAFILYYINKQYEKLLWGKDE